MKISVIGLGKLGCPLVAVFASKGHEVLAVDKNIETVAMLAKGVAPVQETGLQALIDVNRERIFPTTDLESAVINSSVTFVIVPTPSEADGRFSLACVLEVVEGIGAALRRKGETVEMFSHLVVVSSTVMPGSMDGVIKLALEEAAAGSNWASGGLCYNPMFVALGSVIRDILRPDLSLIGESDPVAGRMLADLWLTVHETMGRSSRRMSFINAELTKLAINGFCTAKISYVNMLAQMCEGLPGADVAVVSAAMGCDSRIGSKCLAPGLGFGGPCFPRDNAALAAIVRTSGASRCTVFMSPGPPWYAARCRRESDHSGECDFGTQEEAREAFYGSMQREVRAVRMAHSDGIMAMAADQTNRLQAARLCAKIRERLPHGGTVAIVGLSYKPDTPVIDESQGMMLARCLAQTHEVFAYDPQAMPNAARLLPEVTYTPDLASCVFFADVTVICTPWPEFRNLVPSMFRLTSPVIGMPVLIDCWRLILDPEKFAGAVDYQVLGKGPA